MSPNGDYDSGVDTERARIMECIDEATDRLIATVDSLSDEQVREPSLLEGWTRGHVATHVARSGDALSNMLIWLRTGRGVPGYPSVEVREAEIESGAGRTGRELAADIAESGSVLTGEIAANEDWETLIETPTGVQIPAVEIPARRLVEVELHHTDLGLGYTPEHWTDLFASIDLGEPMRTWRADRLDR